VSLLARSLPIRSQNLIHKRSCGGDLPPGTLGLFPRLRNGAADGFAHHAPVHLQLVRYTRNRVPTPNSYCLRISSNTAS
jgi:hypothetical protein